MRCPSNRERYLSGLDKLEFAAEQVAQMRITLTKLRPQLEASAKETADTMQQIETEDASVKRATILVKKDENVAKEQAKIAEQLKRECEADLAEALPALDEAIGIFIYLFIRLFIYLIIIPLFSPRIVSVFLL